MLGADFGTGYYIWKSMIPAFLGNAVGAALLAVPLTSVLLALLTGIFRLTSLTLQTILLDGTKFLIYPRKSLRANRRGGEGRFGRQFGVGLEM